MDLEGNEKTYYLTIIREDGSKTKLVLQDKNDVRLKFSNGYSRPIPYSYDVKQNITLDFKNNIATVGKEDLIVKNTDGMAIKDKFNSFFNTINDKMTGSGGTQKGGYRMIGGNASDPTKYKTEDGKAEQLDLTPFFTALSVLGKAPGQIPNLNEALGGAEALNTISDIQQTIEEMNENNSSKEEMGSSKNFCPNCSNPTIGQYNAPHGTDTIQKDDNGKVTKDTRVNK
jgi:hypothetical protein